MKISFILAVIASMSLLNMSYAQTESNPEKTYEFYKKLFEKIDHEKKIISIDGEIPNFKKKIKKALDISKTHWSDSVIYDEFAKKNILEPEFLKKIGIPHKKTGGIIHVPAGAMHTYGYMFSQLETQFGKKSKRWVEQKLDERMGLAAGTFSPTPPKGEFLENLTKELRRAVSGENAKAPHVGFIEEEVTFTNGKYVKILTHFIQLMDMGEQKNEKLLVYEIQYKGKSPWFVTAFPVNELFFGEVRNSKAHDIEIFKPRYNWYVDPSYKVKSAYSYGYREVSVDQ